MRSSRLRVLLSAVLAATVGMTGALPAQADAGAPPGSPVTYAHDAAGQLVGLVTQAGGVHRYTYDAAGNQTAVTNLGAPAVAVLSVVPQTARPGERITLTGKGFSTTPASNTVTVNGQAATVNAATATTLTLTVPATATSGAIAVTTPTGSSSIAGFRVDTAAAPRITGFFPATAAPGDVVTLTVTGTDSTLSNNVVMFNQTAAEIVNRTTTQLQLRVPFGAASGPISIRTARGSATSSASLTIVPPGVTTPVAATATLTVGTAASLNIPAGQAVLATVATVEGQRYSVAGGSAAISTCNLDTDVYDTTQRGVAGDGCAGGPDGLWVEPFTSTTGGWYTLLLRNAGASAGSVTLTVRQVQDRNLGTIATDGTTTTLTTTAPGQLAYATFSGTVGNRVAWQTSAVTSGLTPYSYLLAPDGTMLTSRVYGSTFVEPVTLPSTGTYRVVLDPDGAGVGSVTYQMWKAAADVNAGILSLTGTANTLTTTVPGQQAYTTFTGAVGDSISLRTSGITSGISAYTRIYDPSGAQVDYLYGNDFQDPITLTKAGTYKVAFDPYGAGVGAVQLQAWKITPQIDGGTLSLAGTPKTLTTTTPGQTVKVTFTAAAGDRISFRTSALTSGVSSYLRVYAPSNQQLGSIYGAGFLDPITIAAAGTYTAVFDPYREGVGSVTLEAWKIGVDVNAGTLSLSGTPKTLTNTKPGQQAYATFTGAVGDRISLRTSGLTSGISVYTRIYDSSGAQVDYLYGNDFQDPVTLTAAGTYKVVFDPYDSAVGSITVEAWKVPADANAGAQPSDGTARTLTTTVPGQNAVSTFTGAVGDRFSFQTSALSSGMSAYTRIYDPNGAQVGYAYGAGYIDTVTLTVAGTYRVVVDPYRDKTGSIAVQAWRIPADANVGTMSVGGPSKTVTTTVPGQGGLATFTAPVGSKVTLTVTNAGSCCTAYTRIYDPNGSQLNYVWNSGTTTVTILVAGTHRIVFDPYQAHVGSATWSLTAATGAPSAKQPDLDAVHDPTLPAPRTSVAASVTTGAKTVAPQPVPKAGAQPATKAAAKPAPKPAEPKQGTAPAWVPSPTNLAGAGWSTGRTAPKLAPQSAAPKGVTAVGGIVLDLDGSPLANVVVTSGNSKTTTDAQGRFLVTGVRAGRAVLTVDGTGLRVHDRTYGVFRVAAQVTAGSTTALTQPVWMARLDTRHTVKVDVPTKDEVVLTTPEIPGLQVRIPKGSVIRDHSGKVVTELGITPLPVDRLPYGMPTDRSVPVYFTVQPGGATIFPSGAKVVYPNYTRLPAGASVDFIDYDVAGQGWRTYGQGTVSADGAAIEPNADTRVWNLDGFSIGIGGLPLPKLSWWKDFVDWLSGDPVELSTGQLTDAHTDLGIQDVIPISVTRNYWQGDGAVRPFGLNQRLSYDWYLNQTVYHAEVDLYLPEGGLVHFSPNPAGTGSGVDLIAVNAPPQFRGARLRTSAEPQAFDLTLPDGTTWNFPWQGLPNWVKDRNGNTVRFVRDHATAPTKQIISPSGRWIAFDISASGRVTAAHDNIGRRVSYGYDASNRLTTVTDPLGKVTTYTYDADSRVSTITDGRGVVYLSNVYDANGRVSAQTVAGGGRYQFAYSLDTAGKVTATTVTDPVGAKRRVSFDAAGRALTDTAAFGTSLARTTTLERGSDGRVLATVDPYGRRTTMTFDGTGRPTSTTVLAGTADQRRVSQVAYGPFDLPAVLTDAAGKKVTNTYDSRGNLLTSTDADSRRATFTYGARGQVLTVRDNAGATTTMTYQGMDVETVTDATGRTVRRFVDAVGREIWTRNAGGVVATTEYTILGDVASTTDGLGRKQSMAYDANGNLTKFTDARGNSMSWAYTGQDLVQQATDALGRASTYTYDKLGRATQVTSRAGKVTALAYDTLGRTTTARFGVTATGQESTQTYSYDAFDRVRQIADSSAGNTTSTYDAYDQLASTTGPSGTTAYTYDVVGRLATATVAGQPAQSYTYSPGGLLTGTTNGSAASFTYDGAGRPLTTTLPGGWKQTNSYDAAGRVTRVTYAFGAVTKGEITHGYDAAGLRTSVGGSLGTVTTPAPRSGLVYDNANRLTSANGTALTYDHDGNLTGDGISTYTWNARGELTGVSKAGTAASFGYDALGQRTKRTLNGATRTYTYNGDNQAVTATVGTTAQILSAGVNEWLARTQGGVTDAVLTDALGSPVALGRSDGQLSARYASDPFGTQARTGDPRGADFGFTGQIDDGTGLVHMRGRYYSPALGRFISEDPIGLAGGTNLYAYVQNSPANLTDPSGFGAVVGCLVGAAVGGIGNYAYQRFSGRKVDWGDVGMWALGGCAVGAGVGWAWGARAAGGVDMAGARFAQSTFREGFSAGGRFAGQTVDDVAAGLRSGQLSPRDVPIDVIVRDGRTLILNTRSSQALTRAGVPRSQWTTINRTGDAAYEARLSGQLSRNNLTSEGTTTVRSTGRR